MMIYKRTISILLALILAISIMIPTASAVFSDVPSNAWYANDVNDVQRYGILKGTGNNKFNPNGNMSLAEAITLTARTYAYLRGETIPTTNSSPWYNDYVKYANDNGICSTGEFGTEYNKFCNRLTMAHLFARVVSQEKTLNSVTELPDVQNKDAYKDVFYLYNQGILTGSDEYGTFKPYSQITRAEAAAILNRVLNASKRIQKTLTPIPSFDGVYSLASTKHGETECAPDNSWLEIKANGIALIYWDGTDGTGSITYTRTGNNITLHFSDGDVSGTVKPNVIDVSFLDDMGGVHYIFAKKGSAEEKSIRDKAVKEYAAVVAKEQAQKKEYSIWNAAFQQAKKYFADQVRSARSVGYNVGSPAWVICKLNDTDSFNVLLYGYSWDDENFNAIYTIQGDHAVCLATAGLPQGTVSSIESLSLVYSNKYGTLLQQSWNSMQGGGSTFYKVNNNSLKLVASVVVDYTLSDPYWYSTTKKSEDFWYGTAGFTAVSEARLDSIINSFDALLWPFSTDDPIEW